MGIFMKSISYQAFKEATQELETKNALHSGTFGMPSLMEEWGDENVSRLTDDALHRIPTEKWPVIFQGQVAAEIARRERIRNRVLLAVGIATLAAAIVVPLAIEVSRPSISTGHGPVTLESTTPPPTPLPQMDDAVPVEQSASGKE